MSENNLFTNVYASARQHGSTDFVITRCGMASDDGEYKEVGKISEVTFTAAELTGGESESPIALREYTEPLEFTFRIPRRQVERLIKKLRRLAKLCHIFQHTKSARIREKCFKTLLAAGLIDFGGAS